MWDEESIHHTKQLTGKDSNWFISYFGIRELIADLIKRWNILDISSVGKQSNGVVN